MANINRGVSLTTRKINADCYYWRSVFGTPIRRQPIEEPCSASPKMIKVGGHRQRPSKQIRCYMYLTLELIREIGPTERLLENLDRHLPTQRRRLYHIQILH